MVDFLSTLSIFANSVAQQEIAVIKYWCCFLVIILSCCQKENEAILWIIANSRDHIWTIKQISHSYIFFTVVDQHCWADCRFLRKVFSASVGSSDLQVTANRSSVGFCAQLIRSLSAYFGHGTLLLGLSVLWFIFIWKEDVWHMTKSWSLWVSFSRCVLGNAAFCHHK